VRQNGYLLSRRGRSLSANASGFDTHCDSISSCFDCRWQQGMRLPPGARKGRCHPRLAKELEKWVRVEARVVSRLHHQWTGSRLGEWLPYVARVDGDHGWMAKYMKCIGGSQSFRADRQSCRWARWIEPGEPRQASRQRGAGRWQRPRTRPRCQVMKECCMFNEHYCARGHPAPHDAQPGRPARPTSQPPSHHTHSMPRFHGPRWRVQASRALALLCVPGRWSY
jgi:hypothetical protein